MAAPVWVNPLGAGHRQRIAENRPDAKVRYMHSDDYIQLYEGCAQQHLRCVQNSHTKQYDLADIDGIQFHQREAKTARWKKFSICTSISQRKKDSSERAAYCLPKIEGGRRLKSGLGGFDFTNRAARIGNGVAIFLQKNGRTAPVSVSKTEAALFYCQSIRSNVRELEGAFNRVSASRLNASIDDDAHGFAGYYCRETKSLPPTPLSMRRPNIGLKSAIYWAKTHAHIACPRQSP